MIIMDFVSAAKNMKEWKSNLALLLKTFWISAVNRKGWKTLSLFFVFLITDIAGRALT